jgi:hypothetical protein
MSRPAWKNRTKARKTFSLSREAVSYLEALRAAKRSPSISSVLEDLIRQRREAEEAQRISASISGYYDSLSDDQVAEDRAWGEFAEGQLSSEHKP